MIDWTSRDAGVVLLLLALVGVLLQWDTVMEDLKARKAKKEGDSSSEEKPSPPD